MKMAQLSARSGVGAPTIRYYIREGLVPAGELTSPNQAVYDETHLQALRLVRALIDVGGLSVPGARSVLEHLRAQDPAGEVPAGGEEVVSAVQYALTPTDHSGAPAPDEALVRVETLIAGRWWTVSANNPARATLARTLVALEELGAHEVVDLLDQYAAAAEELAEQEAEILRRVKGAENAVVSLVALNVLGDRMLSALRRLAQEDAMAAPAPADPPGRAVGDSEAPAGREAPDGPEDSLW
ncbi:MAG: MerR family transcriptional regulator [Actinomyces sp.]|uniref:MerR family transcriptional regulator n=1 Tax=Actinomyces sp. TaxID=29317 RepID=UPI0026DAE5DD|nr:MerR family transcriptional regulator [Actinomyces sp.]MDO4243754.1 MerR family transcriptional regulator [Actinomyces sp.]